MYHQYHYIDCNQDRHRHNYYKVKILIHNAATPLDISFDYNSSLSLYPSLRSFQASGKTSSGNRIE
jgi:hypothetical protein